MISFHWKLQNDQFSSGKRKKKKRGEALNYFFSTMIVITCKEA